MTTVRYNWLDLDPLGYSPEAQRLIQEINARGRDIEIAIRRACDCGSVEVYDASAHRYWDAPGLVFADDFDRGNNYVVGNGWYEDEVDGEELQVYETEMMAGTVAETARLYRSSPARPDSYTLHVTQKVPGSGACSVLAQFDLALNQCYYHVWDSNTDNWILKKNTVQQDSYSEDCGTNWFHNRLVVEKDGTDLKFRGYGVILSSREDEQAVALKTEWTDTSPYTHDDYGLAVGWYTSYSKYFRLYGFNVVVSGLPTGWKAKVDSGSAVTESGGVATINVDAYKMPATLLTILDGSDVVRATKSYPVNGFYGGATFVVA